MNMQQIMKQAQAMQKKMLEAQEKVKDLVVDASAGGDMVKLQMNGEGKVIKLEIDKSTLDADNLADDIEVLEDLLVTAFNNARKKLDAESEGEMGDVAGSMGMPAGFKMPF